MGVPHVVHVGSQIRPSGDRLVDRLDASSLAVRLRAPHDGYFVVCDVIGAQLQQRGVPKSRIFNVKNAVDTERFRPGTGTLPQNVPDLLPDGRIVGFVGGLHDYKGVHDLTAAIEQVQTDVTLLVAGDGPARSAMEARLGRKGLFLGAVPYEGIPGIYDLVDVLALPSHTEGLPRVVLEAAAMETPVVATRVGGVDEFITDGETGLLCAPRRPKEFAAALDRLLGNADLRRSLATAARKQVSDEYSWERMYDRYESGLKDTV